MLCLSKGENCPSLNLVQAVFSLHLHSATWSVLSTVILLHFTQVLRNYTGKCNHQLSETLMAALPLALLLPPGCIRLSTKFRFNHPLFTHENTRNHIWLICKKKNCSYRECQEHKLLQRKLPFISSSVLLMAPAWRKWHPQGPFHCCLKN